MFSFLANDDGGCMVDVDGYTVYTWLSYKLTLGDSLKVEAIVTINSSNVFLSYSAHRPNQGVQWLHLYPQGGEKN